MSTLERPSSSPFFTPFPSSKGMKTYESLNCSRKGALREVDWSRKEGGREGVSLRNEEMVVEGEGERAWKAEKRRKNELTTKD